MIDWCLINTHDGSEDLVLVYVEIAEVQIVRLAGWIDGERWEEQNFPSQDEARGWWAYRNSVSAEKLEGIFEPTHWAPFNEPEPKPGPYWPN